MDLSLRAAHRATVARAVRELFPRGCFPQSSYDRAADDLLRGPWAAPLLRRLDGADGVRGGGVDPEAAGLLLLDQIDGTPLHALIVAAAVREVLRDARVARAAVDLPSVFIGVDPAVEGCG